METQNGTTTENSGTTTGTTQAASSGNAGASQSQANNDGPAAPAGASGAQTTGAGNDGAAPAGAGANPAEQQAAYTPNFKFKVKDKELEFDDFIKPIVKDKTLEQKMRDIYEKAHGLDEVKSSRETFKTQAQEWQGKYTQVETGLKTLGNYVKKKDYQTFFDVLQIPKEDIINWSIQELKYQELPPEQKAAIDAQRQQSAEFEAQASQNQTLQQQLSSIVQKQATMELDQALATPDIVSVAQAYDSKMQKPGSFRLEVIRRGQYYEAVHKISPPASQLVQEILALVGAQASEPQTQQASSQGQSGQTNPAQPKPTISNFQSGGAKSPTRKTVSSIDDLRKMRQSL